MAILNNDNTLKSLGFSGKHSQYYDLLRERKDDNQMELPL